MDNVLCLCSGEQISSINYIIYMISVIPFTILTSIMISSLLVEKFVWRPYVKKSLLEKDDIYDVEVDKKTEYTDKYVLSEQDMKKESGQSIDINMNRCILEMTPNGIVIMKYNSEKWDYWADKKNNISFDELETVCRRYCLSYKCGFLYKDRKQDIEKQKVAYEKKVKAAADKIDDEQAVESDDDVFVKLKQPEVSKKKIVSALVSNKFKYCGDINSFPGFNMVYEKKNDKNDVGWSAWKNML